ncbi:MAG: MaoC family dehydratase N-terminal domain-containing protein [candidate division Zixibacteria bacterium]|nr:MaoC family dehydratase N-terminal domain-containing protein [candidate division Zixibacteria bacterium]
MRAGDTLTSSGHIVEKYERRGNKFVTIRVEADNQRGERVAEYDYTCIFEFGKGQKKAEGE